MERWGIFLRGEPCGNWGGRDKTGEFRKGLMIDEDMLGKNREARSVVGPYCFLRWDCSRGL